MGTTNARVVTAPFGTAATPGSYQDLTVDDQGRLRTAPGTDANGNAARNNADGTPYQPTYVLAGAPVASLAALTRIAFASNVTGGSYVFDAQFAGTSPSLKLQALAADGATYRDVGSALSASGSLGVTVGQGASLFLYNASASNAITGLSANLT